MHKLFLLLFLWSGLYAADDFEYLFTYEKKSLVVKEEMLVSLEVKQKKINEVLNFDLIFPPSDAYTVELIDSVETKDIQGRVQVKSKYLFIYSI